jgi:hypothetical protein
MGEVGNMTTQIVALMVTALIGSRVHAFTHQRAPALEKLKCRCGHKSYFNERLYMRPEALVAFAVPRVEAAARHQPGQ